MSKRPPNYVPLPGIATCTCPKLWREADGEYWCCNENPLGTPIAASPAITQLRFSQQCGFIAKNAAAWAADTLDLITSADDRARPETVFRFTDEMRQRLDHLDEMAGRARPEAAA